MLQDVVTGAIFTGVTHATFLAQNSVVAFLWLLLASLLVYTCFTDESSILRPT